MYVYMNKTSVIVKMETFNTTIFIKVGVAYSLSIRSENRTNIATIHIHYKTLLANFIF